MREIEVPRPAVTVAAIVARDDRFLLVEEHTRAGLRLNQPAGHLEPAETLAAAVVRETLEETAYAVTLTALVGIYRWQAPETGATFLRFAFAADVAGYEPGRTLDDGIVRALWLTPAALEAEHARHRSPLVWRAAADFLAGRRHPLDLLQHLT